MKSYTIRPALVVYPLVVDYLKTHSLADLEKDHGVYARIAGHKFSLNYDQLEARDSDALSQECRGLILYTADGRTLTRDEIVGKLGVLARPMDRFFNFGQGSCASVDFSSPDTMIHEKVDGTLCIVYNDGRKAVGDTWCVATRSVPEADLLIDGIGDYTFASLFKSTFTSITNTDFQSALNKVGANYTLCFELMTPYNTVVVKHDTAKLCLLAVRRSTDGMELSPVEVQKLAKQLGVPVAPSYPIASEEAVVAFVNSRGATEGKGVENEGVVVSQHMPDGKVLRCKIKSAAYLMASRVKSSIGASPRNLMELILLDQIDDVLPLLTDVHVAAVEAMREDLRVFLSTFDEKWAAIKAEVDDLGPMSDHNHRKQFARAVGMADLWMAPSMTMFEGKTKNIHDWVVRHKDRTNDKAYPAGFLDLLCRMVKGSAKKHAACK
ncbi:MAG: RNA ligase [Candidatus Paceibacterota bacterium]|jgi:hypothetical protein